MFAPVAPLYVPGGHRLHAAAFRVVLYCPAGHTAHAAPATYEPAPHDSDDSHATLPLCVVVVPAGHWVHCVLPYPAA